MNRATPNYRSIRFCENLNVAQFASEGRFDIPLLQPCEFAPCDFVGFNFARSTKNASEKGLHFFVDDYQFERVWRNPDSYTDLLSKFQIIMTPDFSLYTDYPLPIQIYNHYRKHWLGAFWQSLGMQVIPTIAWSDEKSFDWCFDGTPTHSTVAVSSVGTQKSKHTQRLFLDGWHRMIERLQPETVIFYGNVPSECKGNIVHIKAFCEKFKEVKVNGW